MALVLRAARGCHFTRASLAAAARCGYAVDLQEGATTGYPVLETPDGCVFGPTSILRHVSALRRDALLNGDTFADAGAVDSWVEWLSEKVAPLLRLIACGSANTPAPKLEGELNKSLAIVDKHLLRSMFLGGEAVSRADLLLVMMCEGQETKKFLNVTRLCTFVKTLAFVQPVLGAVPAAVVVAEANKGVDRPAAAAAAAKGGDKAETGKKEKKEKPAKTAPAPARAVDDVSRLELRVGTIVKVWAHPDAEKLWCEEINLGAMGVRQIASGLRDHVTQEALEGAKVMVLANLKARPLRGFASHGMVMCCTSGEGQVVPVSVPAAAKNGDRIEVEGFLGDHDEVLNSKSGKAPWDACAPDLKSNANKEGSWRGRLLKVAGAPVTTAFADAKIS